MADWTGQLNESSTARGVWIRSTGSSGMVEELPSLPGDLDDVPLYPTVVEEDTEVTDTTAAAPHPGHARLHPVAAIHERFVRGSDRRSVPANRAPATLPPPPQRVGRPQPQALYDEAPDPFEKTPPTFDMGLVPNTSADLDVTETGESNLRFPSAGDPGSAVFDELPLIQLAVQASDLRARSGRADPRTSAGLAHHDLELESVIQPIRRISAQESADRDVISEIDLDEEWLEIDLPAPLSTPTGRLPASASMLPRPQGSRPEASRAPATPPAPAPRAAGPHPRRPADAGPHPQRPADAGPHPQRSADAKPTLAERALPAYAVRAPAVQPVMPVNRSTAPVPPARLFAAMPSDAPSSLVPIEAPSQPAFRPDPTAFDATADTKPLARMPITLGEVRMSWIAQAGWWCAGAVVGVGGASAIAGLTFVAVLLV